MIIFPSLLCINAPPFICNRWSAIAVMHDWCWIDNPFILYTINNSSVGIQDKKFIQGKFHYSWVRGRQSSEIPITPANRLIFTSFFQNILFGPSGPLRNLKWSTRLKFFVPPFATRLKFFAPLGPKNLKCQNTPKHEKIVF